MRNIMNDEETIRQNEITNCKHDSSYFINKFLRVETASGPTGIILDTPKEELIDVMETEPLTVGRYPRIYGKTTTLAGFALHKALFWGKTVLYGSVNTARRIDFLRQVSYIHQQLPSWMQQSHREGPDGFVIGPGMIFPITNQAWDLHGRKFDYVILDEVGFNQSVNVQEFANITKASKAKFAVVGTFKPDNPIVGKIWSDARESTKSGWASLPSFEEMWKVETILSLVDQKYAVDY
jgi:hypothetical protein